MTKDGAFVFIGIILFVCSFNRCINAKPTQISDISVLYQMKHDKEVCPLGAFFPDSNYAKICDKVKFPSGNVTLNPNDSEQFLCLGMYDRIVRLCYLDTRENAKKLVLPNKVDQFDAEVDKLLPKSDNDIEQFCHKWNNSYPPRYEKIQSYVVQLESAMKKHITCLKLCTDASETFIPLCSVLAKMDGMSVLTGLVPDTVNETPDIKFASQTQVVQSQAAAQNAKIVGENEAADSQKSVESPDAILSLNNSGEKLTKASPDISKADANVEKSQQNNLQETSNVVSSPEMKKSQLEAESKLRTENTAVAAGNDPETDAGNNKEITKVEDKVEEPKNKEEKVKPVKEDQSSKETGDKIKTDKTVEEEAQAKNSDLNNNLKTPESLGPSDDAALQNQGNSGEDISETVGNVLDDPNGVISQHTQDEIAEPIPDADPMDPGDGPLPDEDSQQNAVQPSEKRGEYIPRMPSGPNEDESHFFGYFTVIGVMCIAGYVGYHNKQKILAMVLEGRRGRGGRNRRRPSTANYRKLDCTLEEAVTSQCNSNVTHVIY